MADTDSINIFCTIPAKNGERVPLSVSKTATPTLLRQQASQATSIPLSALRVIFRGRMIKDDDTKQAIGEYKLEADCVLHCMGKPVEGSAAAPTPAASTSTAAASAAPPAAATSFPSVAASGATSTPPATAAPAPADPLKAALQTMRSSNPPATYTTGVTTLDKVLSNIVNNPMEEKYRKVKTGNAAFQKRLGGIPGGDAAMKAVGFIVETQDGVQVYQMQASPEAWPQLLKDKQTIEAAVQEAKSASSPTAAPAAPGANPFLGAEDGAGAMAGGLDPAMMQRMMAGMGGAGGGAADPTAMRNAMQGMMSNPDALRTMLQVSIHCPQKSQVFVVFMFSSFDLLVFVFYLSHLFFSPFCRIPWYNK